MGLAHLNRKELLGFCYEATEDENKESKQEDSKTSAKGKDSGEEKSKKVKVEGEVNGTNVDSMEVVEEGGRSTRSSKLGGRKDLSRSPQKTSRGSISDEEVDQEGKQKYETPEKPQKDHAKTTLKKEITPTQPLISSRPTRASAQQPIDRYRIGPDGEPLPPPTPTPKKKEKEKAPLEESDIAEEKDKEEANNTKVKSLPEGNEEEKKNET